jgi:hypothetical protein
MYNVGKSCNAEHPYQGDLRVKKVLMILACIFAGCLIARFGPGSSLRYILGFLVSIVLIFFVVYFPSRGGKAKSSEKPLPSSMKPDADREERSIHENTARMNQSLRLESGLNPAVLEAFELLIDRIRNLAPKALDQFPDSEMTYDLVELGKSHLPGLADRFLALSPEDRNKNQEDLLCQLRDLKEVVEKAGLALDEGRISDFEAHRDFLKAKFSA